MIGTTINQKIAEAMKARDEIRLSVLRMLSSAFNYERIEKQHDLSEEEEMVVVRKEAKKRKDAIEAYEKVSDPETVRERIAQEKSELAILNEFLPEEMPDQELEKIVEGAISETGASNISDMGRVIGLVMSKTKGQAEGARVSGLVKAKLLGQ